MDNFGEISLLQMELFLRVAEYHNVTQVADSMYLSQSSVTRRIQKLEETLNLTLFTRSNRGLTLTEDGRMLYQELIPAFQTVNAVLRNKQRIRDDGNCLHIAIMNVNEIYNECTPMIQRFQNQHPETAVDVNIVDLRMLREGLISGSFDCIFSFHAAVSTLTGTEIYDIKKMPSYFAVSANADAVKGNKLDYGRLHRYDLCSFLQEQQYGAHERALRLCRATGFEPRGIRYVSEGEELFDLIKNGRKYIFVVGSGFGTRFGDQIRLFPVHHAPNENHYISLAWCPSKSSNTIRDLIGSIAASQITSSEADQ
ncbi:MAG: LysR family transcriptional regulator [Lachnospiraceae bacterium]|nr:LysR family transcriptional regulator [Lachnospiraceae bacterium]